MSIKQRFCSECGAPLGENDKFCPVCGTKVLELDTLEETKSPTENVSNSVSVDDTIQEEVIPPTSPKKKKRNNFKRWLILPLGTIMAYSLYIVYQTGGNLLPYVTAVSFSPSENAKLVSVGSDNYLELWDTIEGKSLKRKKFTSSYGIYRALAWSPDSQVIALAKVNHTPVYNEIILFDARTLNKISTLSTGESVPISLCIDPDGETLYSVSHRLGISVWDMNEGRRLGGLEDLPDRRVVSASFDRNCQTIATLEDKDTITTADDMLVVYQRINMDTLFEIRIDDIKSNPSLIGLDPRGKFVNTLEWYTNKLQSWNIDTKERTEVMIDELRSIHSLAIDKDKRFAIGHSKGEIDVFDNNGKHEQTLRHGPLLGLILEPILNYFD